MAFWHTEKSEKLPAPSDRRPYVWRDGSRGTDMEVGPYQVAVRWNWMGAEPRDGTSYAMLQICRSDGGSIFDWRHLQEIKSSVLGAEWEAVELFPAESRLKDPSNARYLWCSSRILPFGLPGGRLVLEATANGMPQRPLATGANPK